MSDDDTSRRPRLTELVAHALTTPFLRPGARARMFVRAAVGVAALAVVLFAVSGPVTLAVPSSCAACHVSGAAYTSWKASPHAKVRCEQCHTNRAALAGVGNSLALASDFVRGSGSGADAFVPGSACTSCHPRSTLTKPTIIRGLRMSHTGLAEGGYRCVDCHANTAHKLPAARLSSPTMSTCARCHNNVRVSGTCTICHPDETKSADRASRTDPEWAKTHGADWRALHGMGDLTTCTLCHKSSECQECHKVPLPHDAGFISGHGVLAKESKAACLTCHRQPFCDNCHGTPMPHPTGFLANHPGLTHGYDDPTCQKCHVADDCSSCHEKHIHPAGPGIKK
jgi:nitrate/TMAO reductase-like tetraheme cytochrome c subunit